MRFFIALVLIVLYAIVSLATSKGFSDVGLLVGYLIGGAIIAPAFVAALFCIPKSGRNNKRFFRVFNVVLLISIFGHAGEIAKLVETAGMPPKTLVGTNGKIEIVVPASWVSAEPPNENIVLNLKDDSGYLNIIVSYEHTGNDRLELEHFAQLMGNRFEEGAPDFESISKIEPCESTKMESVYQIVQSSTGEKGTTTVVASLGGVEGFYNFIAVTNPGLVEMYNDDIFDALQSLTEKQM